MIGHELGVEQRVAAALSRSTRATRATLLASRWCENMLSPKNAAPSETPYRPPTSRPSDQLDAVRVALPVQGAVQRDQLVVQPGPRPLRAGLGAGLDDRSKA